MLQLEMFMFSVLYIVHVYIFEMTSFDKKKRLIISLLFIYRWSYGTSLSIADF